jgi:hypothetical protein
VDVQFASRYSLARRVSPAVADLHKQALALATGWLRAAA